MGKRIWWDMIPAGAALVNALMLLTLAREKRLQAPLGGHPTTPYPNVAPDCANVVDGAAIHDNNTRARVDLRQTQHRSALAGGLPQNSGARLFGNSPALATVVSHVVTGLERKQRTLGVMMDLTKAFDCVSHDRLMESLQRLGFANEILRWLESYI
ncbi:hypothetical protein J6590_082704 [Homalodisca vitripennis]|nr:hypothetical protein J6590_082704 [Homalodisca vitripennis]